MKVWMPGHRSPSAWIPKVLAAFDAHPFVLVFGLGLVLRFWAVAWLGDAVNDQGGDGVRYLSIARDVLEGRPYGSTSRDYTRVPLYQLFLAAHLWLFEGRLIAVATTQAFLGSLTACVLGLIARDISTSKRWWVVGLMWATYPPAILNTVVVFPQTLQVFWLVLAFWLLLSGARHRSTVRCAGAAACWGFASLTRSGPLLFLPIFAAGPVLLWQCRPNRNWRWAFRVSLMMFVVGFASVLWWTARDFTKTYRLEYLLLNGHERNAAALLLRPIEPVNVRLSQVLRPILESLPRPSFIAGSIFRMKTVSHFTPQELEEEYRLAAMADVVGNVDRERHRFWVKIQQGLGAPDGCVQLACTGPPQGYWALFKAEFSRHPIRTSLRAVGRPCMFLKVLMYIQHYLLLLAFAPALWILFRARSGLATMLLLYVAFVVVGIVFASNYSPDIAAVPRYAFALMPVVILVTGMSPWLWTRTHAGHLSAV
jgi:4-amino-4-deoxy-L-arabinose transferase-like glycosyltransferase